MTADQLLFDLNIQLHYGIESFFPAPANEAALAAVTRWPQWPISKVMLIGAAGSGKTHLAHIWCAMSGAEILRTADEVVHWLSTSDALTVCVDGVDAIAAAGPDAEQVLFHLHNRIIDREGAVLFTARIPAQAWDSALPDLVSRLASADQYTIKQPDDTLIAALIVKQFQDRGVHIVAEALNIMTSRIGRDYVTIASHIDAIDQLSRRTGRPVSDKFVARYFRDIK